MHKIKNKLFSGLDLTVEETALTFNNIMSGKVSDIDTTAILIALKIKQETKATIRCIPIEKSGEVGECIFSGRSSKQRVLFAKAY